MYAKDRLYLTKRIIFSTIFIRVNMKGRHTSLIVFLVLLPLVIHAEKRIAPRVLKVGVYDNPPKIFVDKKGNPDGIFIDVIRSVYPSNELHLEFVYGKWSELVGKLKKGEIDALPDMAYSPERDSLFTLSIPVLSSWLQVYTTTSSIINKTEDLHHKRIGVLKSSSQEEYVKTDIQRNFHIKYTVIGYDTYTQSVEALKAGKIDALIADRFFYFSELCDEDILASGVVLQVSSLHFAFSKNTDHTLVEVLNKTISLQYNQPKSAYYQSLQKWFNKHKTRLPESVRWLIGVLSFAMIVFLLFTVVLRARVQAKTRALNQQNKELIAAKMKAEESDRLKTAFLQNLSHEIRTPLNGILGFVNVLQDPHFNDERTNQFIEIVNKSSERLLSTINDIIEISKIDSNQVEVNPEPVNICAIMEHQYKAHREKAIAKGLVLKVQTQQVPENTSLITDKTMLSNIISILLNNAVKFTNEGTIELGCFIEQSSLVGYVKDTGIGIPPDRLEAIFDRFVNADLELSRPYEGSGLGLAIVKSYLSLLKGTIRVESEEDKGSVFYFTLPLNS